MIRKVTVTNFRCLRQLEMTLEPLTVLVGPNASGKSTLLHALVPRQASAEDQWRHDPNATVTIDVTYDDGTTQRMCPFPGGRRTAYTIFHLDLERLRGNNTL